MANLDLLVVAASGKPTRTPSNAQTVDFTSVRIGADTLELAQGGSGGSAYFDFGSRAARSSFTPANGSDLTNKSYVDSFVAGVTGAKTPVRLATAAALNPVTPAGSGVGKTLTANSNGFLTVDGVNANGGERILVKNQAAGADNGIYVVTSTGDGSNPFILTRATDFDQNSEVEGGILVSAQEGTDNADTAFILATNNPITIDTTALNFVVYPTAVIAGDGLTKTGVTLDVNAGDGIDIVGDAVVVKTGEGIRIVAGDVAWNPTIAKTNDNAGTITAGQVVYVKADGDVDLAQGTVANLGDFALGVVDAASIATTASGFITVRQGAIISGLSGLTPGLDYYVSTATAGALVAYASLATTAGNSAYKVGRALSASTLRFEPEHKFYF